MIKPAHLVGLEFEKGLVDGILDDLGNEPGTLPLLQHTLLELFNGRRGRWLTTDRYRAIGRVKGAIASRAESIFRDAHARAAVGCSADPPAVDGAGAGTEDTAATPTWTSSSAGTRAGPRPRP